jgi:hypothetical protein
MKNLFTILFLTIGFALNAQYYSISYIQVPVEDQAEVARLETQYWSKVAQANIDAGNQLAWGLFARVGGSSDTWTHAFVNVYESIDQMMDLTIWNPEEVLGISGSEIATNTMYTGYAVHHWKIQDQIVGENSDFSVWNYGRPDNLGGFVGDNIENWKPYFEKNNTGRLNWGIATKILPANQSTATVMTWDGYESAADAIKVLAGESNEGAGPSNTNVGEYMPDGFMNRVVVQTVMWVD